MLVFTHFTFSPRREAKGRARSHDLVVTCLLYQECKSCNPVLCPGRPAVSFFSAPGSTADMLDEMIERGLHGLYGSQERLAYLRINYRSLPFLSLPYLTLPYPTHPPITTLSHRRNPPSSICFPHHPRMPVEMIHHISYRISSDMAPMPRR